MGGIRHIVVSTRGSESCKRAEGKAIELARMEKTKLTFLYVIDPSFLSGIPRRVHGVRDTEKGLEGIGKLILERAKEKALKRGVDAEIRFGKGSWKEEIKDFVIRNKVDILIVGGEKRSFLKRLLIKGSPEEISKETGVKVKVIK